MAIRAVCAARRGSGTDGEVLGAWALVLGPSQVPRTTSSVTRRFRSLVTLTVGFVVVASLVFAAVAVSSQGLWAFPIVVSLWTAFWWILIGRGINALSKRPHQPGRIAAIVIGCSFAALAVLAITIFVG